MMILRRIASVRVMSKGQSQTKKHEQAMNDSKNKAIPCGFPTVLQDRAAL
jgi:hypothetical protein